MACCTWRSLKGTVSRKRVFEPGQLESGNLRRCLNRWDLTGLGLGSTLGVGVYILIGYVALHIAGPSIVLSFLIAAVAALFAGLCYAEFGARVPRAGSAYIYTYVTVGEMAAFVVGWSNILESLFGAASVAKGLSLYLDSMVNNTMSDWYTSVVPISTPHMSPYFDILACLVVVTIGILLAVGVRESVMVNNALTLLNMAVILFIVVAGAVSANSSNWFVPSTEVPPNHGSGGFFPYGVWGTLRGAAVCFYGFVGFDTISASSEEARDPRRAVPITIVTVLGIVFIAYASIAIVVTMMVPYYFQDPVMAVAMAFSHVGWDWAKWVVSVGAFFGIVTGLIGAMFPLPRLIYAMSSDGLLLRCFSKVTSKRKSPVFATALSTAIIAILAGLLELEQLIMMMCIGTLLSYTIVSICVILLRYQSDYTPEGSSGYIRRIFGCGEKFPSRASARIINICLVLFICVCVTTALVAIHVESPVIPAAILHALAIIVIIVMAVQPRTKEELTFKTPLVPLIPCLSIYVNIHLMVLINVKTWIRVVIWILIGLPIYIVCTCCYKKKKDNLQENIVIAFKDKNGKPPVQIIVESPTPPDTITRFSNYGGEFDAQAEIIETEEVVLKDVKRQETYKTDEIVLHQAYIENNEEKEAKIIDLLDQVLQAEEDSYGEVISLKEQKEDVVSTVHENVVHRKSLSELSDAGSDASLGNQVLSKYDVIAQVHREDLPRVNEEEERIEKDVDTENIDDIEEQEQVTAFNDSETNSRTDESGYSDTIDRNGLSESLEDPKDNAPYIPVPPPMDENYFNTPHINKFYSLSSRYTKVNPEQDLDEEEREPRESIKSSNSQSDDNIIFGSDRQINFMSKLNNIFQNKKSPPEEEEEPRRRSQSTGNVGNTDFSTTTERPPMFMDLQKELLLGVAAQNLRPVKAEDSDEKETESIDDEDASLSKEDLKSKLESIFASGGPKLLKPRLMKSNPPTPEESYQTDTSSSESIPKLPKIEKNDTLKRQKAKFGEVLNSFRLSLNKDDDV